MSDEITRRQLVRRTALAVCAPALGNALAGCARRISTNRDVDAPAPVDGNVVLARSAAPELNRAGGAVIVHPRGARSVLVVNAGTGLLGLQADCPHERCPLAWVPEDREAECPCHGSRFASDGTLLHPPAVTDLATYPVTADAQSIVIHLFAGDGVFPPVAAGKVVFALSAYPALQTVGGAVVGHPDGLPGPMAVSRTADGFAAVSAVCTHLQCTVLPVPGGGALRCPCHGSGFTLVGDLTRGPAGSPLQRYPVSLSPDGMLTVQVA